MKLCNLDYLKSVTPNSNAFSIQMIKLFLQDIPIAVKNINEALRNENWQEIHRCAHKIKPFLIMLGIPQPLTESLLLIIENSKNEKKHQDIKNQFFMFEKGIELVYIELIDTITELENEINI